jgi:uncharacterized protein (TIGR03435 family)
MANRIGHSLNRAKKLLLASAGIAALAGPVVVGIGHAPSIRAQSRMVTVAATPESASTTSAETVMQAVAPAVQARPDQPKPQDSPVIPRVQEKPLAFDAASIKLAATSPAGGRAQVGDGAFRYPPGRVIGSAVTARRIIMEAYHLSHYQLSGGPPWINSDRFDFEGKTETAADQSQLRLMLQALLAERFGLEVHRGSAEMPVYTLTVGKGGLRIQERRGDSTVPVVGTRPPEGTAELGVILTRGTVQNLADRLNSYAGAYLHRPVLDRTGITEVYQFTIGVTSWDNVMADVEEQTGLKCESRKAVMETLVIDHIEKPSPN